MDFSVDYVELASALEESLAERQKLLEGKYGDFNHKFVVEQ
jgi:hypothetical protein